MHSNHKPPVPPTPVPAGNAPGGHGAFPPFPIGHPPFGGEPDKSFAPGPPPPGWTPPMADISWVARKLLDVPYGTESAAQRLDLYYPDSGDGPFPAVIHIHGGGFALGDKRDSHMAAYLDGVRRGYVVGSIEYRFSGEAIFPAAVLDVRNAIRFLRRHAAEYSIDPGRIGVIGGSAGGNLVALLAMNIPNGAFCGERESAHYDVQPYVCAAVDQFGPVDFKAMDRQARENGISFADHDRPDSAESKYLGVPLPQAEDALCAMANPASYISDRMCPLLIQHGRVDRLVPFQQSECFYREIERRLGPGRASFVPLDTADHEDRQFTEPENMRLVWDFFAMHLQ